MYLCKYCLGCNKEELENFEPRINCKDFVPAYKDWQEKYYSALKKANGRK